MTDDQKEPLGFWQRPVTRGVANGIVFAGLLMAMQVNGIFQPARPLTDESITQHLFAGVVFGFIMYIIELWKLTRRTNAEKAARMEVERRLREQEEDGDDKADDGEEREDDRLG